MPIHEWNHICSLLQFDDETKLGVSVIKDMLTEAVSAFINKNCEGCQENLPSQIDHSCLMGTNVNGVIDNLFDELNIFEFNIRLAKMAERKCVVLKKPKETFDLIRALKKDELKSAIISKFDV